MPDTELQGTQTVANEIPTQNTDGATASTPISASIVDNGDGTKTLTLQSGATAKILPFTGAMVMQAQAEISKNKNDTADSLIYSMMGQMVEYNGQIMTNEVSDEMDGFDLLGIMGFVGEMIAGDENSEPVPKDAPAGSTYLRLPSGKLALISGFKGKDIKMAQREVRTGDTESAFLWTIISRLAKIDGNDIFPEDLNAMDGRDVIALMGAFAATTFPNK